MWSSIKDILKDGKTKCVIIEDGEPRYVVLPFEAYQQLQKSEKSVIVGENSQNVGTDEINGEIQEMTDEGEDELAQPTVKLEDLPF